MTAVTIILGIVAAGGVVGAIYLYLELQKLRTKPQQPKVLELSEDEAIAKASNKAKDIIQKAEKDAIGIRSEAEKSSANLTKLLEEKESRLDKREKSMLERSKSLDERFEKLEKSEKIVEDAKIELKEAKEKIDSELERIAQLTKEQAKAELIKKVEGDLSEFTAKRIKEAEARIEKEADNKARELVIDAMQRSATDYVAETTSTTIEIEKEEEKGKIIGKDGRNIRTFERLTGVDIIIDEAPNQVTVSSFDPIRREVAAIAIQKLLKDGRVHPGTIEESIQNIKEDIAKEIRKTGEKIAYDTGFSDLPIEIIKLLGRFKYRFSYGQNLVKHSLEMVNIGQQLAQELGADVMLTKKACLLHDIGKVLTHEIEGKPHHHISGDLVRKYLKDEKLANAVESHHGDIKPLSKEAILVQIADAISSSRPGARKDNYEEYIKRIKALEEIAQKHEGVKQAFAIFAGREVRVIVDPQKATDEKAEILAYEIAKEIQETQNYPGIVRVNVIREMRFVGEAK